jgi:glycosidase
MQSIHEHLNFLYGETRAQESLQRLEIILKNHHETFKPRPEWRPLSEKDVVLITYPDQLHRAGEKTLRTLTDFLSRSVRELISIIHVLPFYPYSSDDGFSVIDYRQVHPDFGDWEDIEQLGGNFQLMFDAVINHASAQSPWFQKFGQGIKPYRNYFIPMKPDIDLSSVVRPRDLPLLTPFKTWAGTQHLWTTFSADQIDLNYANPDVLLEIIDLLLFYVRRGARILRLDAIAFLWKEVGTSCIHLPQTHRIIRLFRSVLNIAAPEALLLTETNVPHEENLSYFGNGENEAHMVYQFALPPLILHTLVSGDASRITAWAAGLRRPSNRITFFNFTASHDGIGLRPAHGILSEAEIERLIALGEKHGGGVSYRRVGSDERQPYELNINYFDAMNDPQEALDHSDLTTARFLASQAMMLSFAGIPAIYFHSLFGSRSDFQGIQQTGKLRTINRQKLKIGPFRSELRRFGSLRKRIFEGYRRLLKARQSHPAFNPWGEQEVVEINPKVFGLLRIAPGSGRRLLCLTEVCGQSQSVAVNLSETHETTPYDLLAEEAIDLNGISLSPYQVRWISLN